MLEPIEELDQRLDEIQTRAQYYDEWPQSKLAFLEMVAELRKLCDTTGAYSREEIEELNNEIEEQKNKIEGLEEMIEDIRELVK